ncbi:MAG: nucleoside hydrolase [Clostridiales bacterium]|nr:nucleoside hydrolase [Clostridiales bacterium]
MLTTAQRLAMLEIPTGLIDVVIDSDTYNEIDDQFAISLALLSPERCRVQALYAAPFLNHRSTSPEDGMEKSYQEMGRLLQLLGQAVPHYRGATCYLPDEETPVLSDASRDLAARAMQYSPEKPLYVVALGAITNVASALLLQPEIADRVVIVFLGGHSLDWPQNREFNLSQDVAASRIVYGCGAPLVMLPCLGVVSTFTTTGPELDYWLRGRNALCDFLVKNTVDEVKTYAEGKVWSRVLWDVTAVAWLLNDEHRYIHSRLIPTPVPEYDHHWGSAPLNPLCRYAYHINRDALLGDLFRKLTEGGGEA